MYSFITTGKAFKREIRKYFEPNKHEKRHCKIYGMKQNQ
jgi:hypothetical protein